ncbi:MAG TPA: hypothetical protein VE089_02555 [Nitrososphaeraceae archaeon]|nr:hypothetical protein [Nitrososphaeraceae archaeon]
MSPRNLFFIYIAKNEEWRQRQEEDWNYLSSMVRFYHWWIKRFFEVDFKVDIDILPVIPGRLFDRMSIDYLARDHNERGKTVYHFYLAYFKPFWTDCQTEGYATDNFGMVQWKRPPIFVSDSVRSKFFADTNCAKVSHILSHEVLRLKGKKRKEYFESVHNLWDHHLHKNLPYLYYNERFTRVSRDSLYRFVTIDVSRLGI